MVPRPKSTGQLREYTLEVHPIRTEISPGVTVEQWAFGLPGQPATVPGPELRARVDALLRITLVNTHTQPHTLHRPGKRRARMPTTATCRRTCTSTWA